MIIQAFKVTVSGLRFLVKKGLNSCLFWSARYFEKGKRKGCFIKVLFSSIKWQWNQLLLEIPYSLFRVKRDSLQKSIIRCSLTDIFPHSLQFPTRSRYMWHMCSKVPYITITLWTFFVVHLIWLIHNRYFYFRVKVYL